MILPKTDISIMMVRNALGYPSTDLGTLCRCNNVNMWSRYKPVPFPHDSVNAYPNWWQGNYGRCGINIPDVGSNFDQMMTANWTRDIPAGGSAAPFRLGDFRGYNHDAKVVIGTTLTDDVVVNRADTPQWRVLPYIYNGSDSSNLNIDDIQISGRKLGNFYMAMRLSYNGATVYACSNDIIRNRPYIQIDLSKVPDAMLDNKATAMFFICSESFEQRTNWIIQDLQYCLYSDENNKSVVGFTIKEQALFTVLTEEIGASLGVYYPVGNYHLESNPLVLRSAGDIYLKCTFRNRTGGNYQVLLSQFTGISQNWWNGSVRKSPLAFYNLDGTIISGGITIPANSTVQYIIMWRYSYKDNAQMTPPFNVTIKGNVNFKYTYNGVSVDVSNETAQFYVQSSD